MAEEHLDFLTEHDVTVITENVLKNETFLTTSSYYMRNDINGYTLNGTPDYFDIFGYDHHVLYLFYLTTGAIFVASLIEE